MFLSDINETVIESFPGVVREYLSCDTVGSDQEDEHTNPVECLNNLTAAPALPDHKLKLKKEAITKLLRTIGPCKEHVNG